jgi:hypothetical protein
MKFELLILKLSHELPQGFGVRQSSGAFQRMKAAEGCRSPRRYRDKAS